MTIFTFAVFVLAAAGIYLCLGRDRFRIILGLSLLAHAANLVLLVGSSRPGATPALLGPAAGPIETMADPLPQAIVLTAIVISMALTLYLLGLFLADAAAVDQEGRLEEGT